MDINLTLLGQSGCRIEYRGHVIYMDPYLSHSVQELDAPDLVRLVPVPIAPQEITDANWVIITHAHIDHCDPHTLPHIATASPSCQFMGPAPVVAILNDWGIAPERCHIAEEKIWFPLGNTIQIRAVPAAHPTIERDGQGRLACVGYVMRLDEKNIYLAGDTSVAEEVIGALKPLAPINAALLPVNERNFFRDRRGIIGNMSIREAFLFATEIGAHTVIPVHWDMFAVNSVDPSEIRAVYQEMKPGFQLLQSSRVAL